MDGNDGAPGAPGAPGADSTVAGPRGLPGVAGSDGEDGAEGPAGQTGEGRVTTNLFLDASDQTTDNNGWRAVNLSAAPVRNADLIVSIVTTLGERSMSLQSNRWLNFATATATGTSPSGKYTKRFKTDRNNVFFGHTTFYVIRVSNTRLALWCQHWGEFADYRMSVDQIEYKGSAGVDGEAAAGIEYVFAATNTTAIAASKRPLNTWGFDSPVETDGLTWHDGAVALTADLPNLWRSQRGVVGLPDVGDTVAADWTDPVIVSHYGRDGSGEAGAGVEYVFAITNTLSVATSKRPSNAWGYDRPGTRGGLAWSDAAPGLTADLPNLWRSQRLVGGVPTVGDTVPADWTDPVIVSHFGTDGDDGDDGDDGENAVGYEYIFAASNTTSIAVRKRPLNSWGYDAPAVRDGLTWSDAAPTLIGSGSDVVAV